MQIRYCFSERDNAGGQMMHLKFYVKINYSSCVATPSVRLLLCVNRCLYIMCCVRVNNQYNVK